MLGILDGTVLPADEVRIPARDEGLLRGDGVFEVMRLYDGHPFAIDDHLERMERSARNLLLPLDADAVRADIHALLDAGKPSDGVVRVLVTRG
ncbi:MAG: branched-chain amino acid aminotransferase, partial [Solirubrobacteraceae bacterium]|nr:branched-chain amino acid aminotransferase [Solirubrobacteraceae bacterium]